ncbi:alanine racemase [Agromyces sp. LHK192]|uniref:alanine racemase n=1 Tax=Agromyces sp. LHK192 TaxID=2498704 RepID=UPI000FD79610|nr:alanine racemase [Agromyces sp. LHK192]
MPHLDADALAGLDDLVLSPVDTGLPARAAGMTARDFLATAPTIDEFWTPLTVLDRAALEHNADTIQAWSADRGLELMPHGKTTMAPALWQLQLERGATGLTLATPGQVRTARAFGATSIQLANAIAAPQALAWLAAELSDEAFAFRSWADSAATVEAMERGLAATGADRTLPRPIDVLVELGAPGGRTGARTVDEAIEVARRITASPVLRLAGVAGYEGSLGHDRSDAAEGAVRGYLGDMLDLFTEVRGLRADQGSADRRRADDPGADDPILSAGGSAYLDLVAEVFAPAAADPGARVVLRSGASLVHDEGFYRGISPIDEALRPAMRGVARVVSHPEPGLALLDGGKRDLPYDEGLPIPLASGDGVGAALRAAAEASDVRPLAEASVTAVNDQHAYLRSDAPLPVAVGDVVALGLSHPCTAFDKRRVLPVVEHAGSDLVVALVRTLF